MPDAFRFKPGASVAVARRGGISASFDALNKYFGISQMPVAGSTYWNMVHGAVAEDAPQDEEGMQTMRLLGQNFAWLVKSVDAAKKAGIELPARVEEVHHAKEEGIIFDLLTNPIEILSDENGWVNGIKCIKMELGEPDASGRRRPVAIEGSEFVMDVDTVIMSLGTSPNPLISSTTEGLEVNKYKCIIADEEHGKTTKEGVYAGGDAVTGAATVILAMGAGKAAAKGIDEYLSQK